MEDLIQILRKGLINDKQLEELINFHLPIVMMIANKASKKSPHLKDLLQSEAQYILVKCIREAKDKLIDNNLTAYIASTTKKMLLKFAFEFKVVRVPYSSHKLRGKKIVNTYSMRRSEGVIDKASLENNVRDMKELIEISIRTKIEKEVIKLRAHGYEDKEIAERLNLDQSRIGKLRRTVERRFNERIHNANYT